MVKRTTYIVSMCYELLLTDVRYHIASVYSSVDIVVHQYARNRGNCYYLEKPKNKEMNWHELKDMPQAHAMSLSRTGL